MAVVALMTVPVWGQSTGSAVPYAPKKGDVQVGVLIGPSTYFSNTHNSYLLPKEDTHGEIKGFRSNKTRRLFDAYLTLEKGKLKFDFPPREFKPRRFFKKSAAKSEG